MSSENDNFHPPVKGRRIEDDQKLPSPTDFRNSFSPSFDPQIHEHRSTIETSLDGGRPLVIVGPCSIHDAQQAVEYATLLAPLADKLSDSILIIMRCYFEKPRTILGWRGLVADPHMDGTNDMVAGLTVARCVLLAIAQLGLPIATEFLDLNTPQYLADLVSWSCLGARTVESPGHRHLASGLSMPVGAKNPVDGSIKPAVDACLTMAQSHAFMGIGDDGCAAVLHTTGNPFGHVVLRGGRNGPNDGHQDVATAVDFMEMATLRPRIVVDCSHGNARGDYKRQAGNLRIFGSRIAASEPGLRGVMVESFLKPGRQDTPTVHGVSITDACLGWEETESALIELAEKVAV